MKKKILSVLLTLILLLSIIPPVSAGVVFEDPEVDYEAGWIAFEKLISYTNCRPEIKYIQKGTVRKSTFILDSAKSISARFVNSTEE